MPRKLRQLIAELRDAGFVLLPGRGKGDHALWAHPLAPEHQLTIDGQAGDDAKRYQEKQIKTALTVVAAAKQADQEG